MDKPFDVVWCNSETSERAIRSLALLSDDEMERRGKSHHFAIFKNAPQPNIDGTRGVGKCLCIYTDRLGLDAVNMGGIAIDRTIAALNCSSPLIDIEPGFIGGYWNPHLFDIMEIKKAAIQREKIEQETKKIIERERILKGAQNSIGLRKVERSYWTTAARMVLMQGRENPRNLKTSELQMIVMAGVLTGVKVPTIEQWIAVSGVQVEPIEVEKRPYDPVSFLSFCAV